MITAKAIGLVGAIFHIPARRYGDVDSGARNDVRQACAAGLTAVHTAHSGRAAHGIPGYGGPYVSRLRVFLRLRERVHADNLIHAGVGS